MTPDQVKEKVEALRARLEKARKLAALFERRDYSEMTEWLHDQIEATKRGLCNPQLPAGETTMLRGQFWTLQRIYDLPASTASEIGSIAKEVQGLQPRLERMHTRRPDDLASTMETVKQMSST